MTGNVAEFAGIVLLGFPDLLPGAIRLSRWLQRQSRRTANRLRRLVGRQPLGTVVSAGAATAIATALTGSAVVGTSETTVEGKVEFLLRRDQDSQRQANVFAERLGRLEAESPRSSPSFDRTWRHTSRVS